MNLSPTEPALSELVLGVHLRVTRSVLLSIPSIAVYSSCFRSPNTVWAAVEVDTFDASVCSPNVWSDEASASFRSTPVESGTPQSSRELLGDGRANHCIAWRPPIAGPAGQHARGLRRRVSRVAISFLHPADSCEKTPRQASAPTRQSCTAASHFKSLPALLLL